MHARHDNRSWVDCLPAMTENNYKDTMLKIMGKQKLQQRKESTLNFRLGILWRDSLGSGQFSGMQLWRHMGNVRGAVCNSFTAHGHAAKIWTARHHSLHGISAQPAPQLHSPQAAHKMQPQNTYPRCIRPP